MDLFFSLLSSWANPIKFTICWHKMPIQVSKINCNVANKFLIYNHVTFFWTIL